MNAQINGSKMVMVSRGRVDGLRAVSLPMAGRTRTRRTTASPPVCASGKASERIMTSLLSMSSVPYTSYVPRPRTFLHDVLPEIKLVWVLGMLFMVAQASSSEFRLAMAAMVGAITVISFPKRIWKPQLVRVLAISAFVCLLTACGSDGVPPLVSGGRAPPLQQQVYTDIQGLYPSYRYTILNLGICSITKRSLALAITLFSLTCITLQSASICLVTTPPEAMALALKRFLSPLGWIGFPVHRMYIMVLLSLRFLATVFEEMRNLVLALASRGVDWSQMGGVGTLSLLVRLGTRLFRVLFRKSEAITDAMLSRGFRDPSQHIIYTKRHHHHHGHNVFRIAFVNTMAAIAFALCFACSYATY